MKKHLVLGALLVAATILMFLRDWRTMLIAATSIPVSLISTFMVMQWLGFTLNNITMLALVLAVGIVIDDAVVVHENIFRWMEEKGLPGPQAAKEATSEIALAVMATTFSLVVIFLPIAFMSGRVGRFFNSFGTTIAFAILISLGVGFTMTPMLCAYFLKPSKHGGGGHGGGFYGWFIEKPYMLSLRFALRFRWLIVIAAVGCFASIPFLFKAIGKDFIPKDDQSEFEIAIKSPEGWTLDRFSSELAVVENRLRTLPAIEHLLVTIGDTSGRVAKGAGDVTAASIYVRIADLDERLLGPFDKLFGKRLDPKLEGVSQFKLMRDARKLMQEFPDLRSSVQLPAAVASGDGNGLLKT